MEVSWEDLGRPKIPGNYTYRGDRVYVSADHISAWSQRADARFYAVSISTTAGTPPFRLSTFQVNSAARIQLNADPPRSALSRCVFRETYLLGLKMTDSEFDYSKLRKALRILDAQQVSNRVWISDVEVKTSGLIFGLLKQCMAASDSMIVSRLPQGVSRADFRPIGLRAATATKLASG